jgi:hypothetical protein
MLQPSEGVVNQVGDFISSTVNGLVKCGGLIRDCEGLKSFETSFNHAAHTVITVFVTITVLIAEVNIDRSNAIADSVQSILHDTSNPIDQGFTPFNIVVSSDLNSHGVLLNFVLG